jgi:transcriptional regulator with GAF, ATPase, and Fis domain
VVARAIHEASNRSDQPMVAVNCSALPETLIEAELFGHVKGAFTGAAGQRVGRFEQAHRGSIFLDEIGDLQLEIQGKLLRVLQEHELQRVGSTETIRVDTRVIAATNMNMAEAVKERRFRQDLFYRLQVVPIHLPPLRERVEDIPLLTHHFIEKLCRKEGLGPRYASPAAIERLCAYSWPGNVRQLEHAVEVAVVLSGDRRVLEPDDFRCTDRSTGSSTGPKVEVPLEGLDFDAMMSQFQRYLLQQALEKTGGNKSRAADMLRMKRSTLVSKVKTLAEEGWSMTLAEAEE